jgi:hypothetical protein
MQQMCDSGAKSRHHRQSGHLRSLNGPNNWTRNLQASIELAGAISVNFLQFYFDEYQTDDRCKKASVVLWQPLLPPAAG